MHYHRREAAYRSQYRLNMSEVWEEGKKEVLRLSWWSRKTNKRWSFLYSEHLCAITLSACLVAPESRKGVQIEISIISCLITSQIAIFRQDKSVPSCFASFRLDCFILCLNEKVILWVVLVNRVIQKWSITYTNMTRSSFWPKASHFFQPRWSKSYLHDKDLFIYQIYLYLQSPSRFSSLRM